MLDMLILLFSLSAQIKIQMLSQGPDWDPDAVVQLIFRSNWCLWAQIKIQLLSWCFLLFSCSPLVEPDQLRRLQHLPGNSYVTGVDQCDPVPGILWEIQCESLIILLFYVIVLYLQMPHKLVSFWMKFTMHKFLVGGFWMYFFRLYSTVWRLNCYLFV